VLTLLIDVVDVNGKLLGNITLSSLRVTIYMLSNCLPLGTIGSLRPIYKLISKEQILPIRPD